MVVSPPTPRTVGYKERQTRTRRSLSPTPPPPSPPPEPQAKRLKRQFDKYFTRDQFGTLKLQSIAPAQRSYHFDYMGNIQFQIPALPPPRPRVEPDPEPTPTPTEGELVAFFDGGGGAAAAAQAGVPDPFATDSD